MRALPGLIALTIAAGCVGRTPHPVFSIQTKRDDTLRHLQAGDVVGGEGRSGSHAWLGIPFAAPPVGELRWRAPRPPAPWSKPLEALTFKSACPQFASPLGGVEATRDDGLAGDEDCLYLNVFAPPFDAQKVPRGAERLPVMVWIHGGGNSIGSAEPYDGGHLAIRGRVIVVTVQYRLGPLGWFRHPALRADVQDPLEQSGNFGTLDQIAALEWVRDNISAFGGDPGNVTIFGESAGGQDVYALLVSPRARGLFHRAISESGGLSQTTAALAEHFADDPEPGHKHSSNEVIARLLVKDGRAADRATARRYIESAPPAELAKYLRGRSAFEILNLYRADRGGRPGMLNMPLVVKDGALLPTGDWRAALSRPDGWNRVPVVLGTNRDEAKLFLSLDPTLTWKLLGVVPRLNDEPKYLATAEAMSHAWKAIGADQPAQAMVASGATEVFSYRFDWSQEPTVWGSDLSKIIGAAHGLEIPFIFGSFDLFPIGRILFDKSSRADREALSDAMVGYWTTFARTGRPERGGSASLPEWRPWDASSPEAPKALVLDVPKAGGIRATNDVQSINRVLSEMKADARLSGAGDRCALAERLVSFHWITGEAARGLCDAVK